MSNIYTAKEMLTKLVSFPSVSSVSNLPIIEFIEEYLASHGVESTRVYDDTGEKANLYANVGPNVEGGVILSGHTDVVPTEGQDWHSDPFTLTEKDGLLYGRGSCDMKGFLAIGLSLVPHMLAANLKRPIQLAFSYDEEVGCLGAPRMIKEMAEKLPKAKAVIVGEPSVMKVVTDHKGIMEIETTVNGFEVHSSLVHTGVPAVMVAAELIEWHRARMAENADEAADLEGLGGYNPPYTTLHCGTIEGGTATNITAKYCRFSTDIRLMPGESPVEWFSRYQQYCGEVEERLKLIRPEASIEIEMIASTSGLVRENDGVAETLARSITGDNAEHLVAYATEGGQFQEGGYSTVICGPGNIEQAHQPNEFITIKQLEAGEDFVKNIIKSLS